MRFKAYTLLCTAVALGVVHGVRRAYKHRDDASPSGLEDTVAGEVMTALCEIIDFEAESSDS